MPQIYERILRLTQPGQRTTPPIPPPKSALEAVIALAAAARQSTSDDEGTAFVVEHLRRTINAVQALEDEIVRLRKLAGEPDHI
jgi:hypothetical protein